MDKHQRQRKILDILRAKRLGNQADLVAELERRGVVCTQASVSRDLAELGVVKVDGAYKPPQLEAGQSPLVDRLTAECAGDALVVVRTGPGGAQRAALIIDKARLTGVVGTVAGDDTIFVAVRGKDDQTKAIRRILSLFQGPTA